MNKENFHFSDELDTKEWRHFIYKAVNFFVFRSIEKARKSPFKRIEEEPATKLFEKYKFVYNRSIEPDMELCHLLVVTAAQYINYIEDNLDHELQFPFDCTYLFELKAWFNEIDIRHRYDDEILILLINKLYYSAYRDLILY